MERIFHNNKLIAVHLNALSANVGSHPATLESEALQAMSLKYSTGARIKAHYHSPQRRVTECLQEGLVVMKGRIAVDLYSVDEKKLFKSVEVKAGEVIILADGGHGINFLEDSELFEFKPGPFKDDKILI